MSGRFGVGALGLAAVAFVGGLILGGIGPRQEVRALQDQIFDLKRERSRGGGSQITDMFARVLEGDRGASAPTNPVSPPGEGAPPPDPDDPLLKALNEAPAADAEPLEPPADEVPDLQAAREMMAARAAQARAALVEDAAPDEAQLARIDAAIARMNDQLIDIVDRFSDQAVDGERPSRQVAMRLTADGLDAFVAAEDEMRAALTPEQLADVRDEATDPTSFIDARVIDAFAEVAGRIERSGP